MPTTLADRMMPVLRRLDAERAHDLALLALRTGLVGGGPADDGRLAVDVLGMRLGNPIGLAAGFDKNAVAVRPLLRLGFGAVEVGTVTRLAQPGNPSPRLFRLAEDAAIINRLGFNNAGAAAMLARLRLLPAGLPVGVNIGLNKIGADPVADYPALVALLAPHAAYVTINVSSPNTPGLRDLQTAAHLTAIVAAIRAAVPEHPPLLVKLAPDLVPEALPEIVAATIAAGVAGLIVSNTTTHRPDTLRSHHAGEAGGLSGAPLMQRSTAMLRQVAELAAGRLALVGVGGVMSGADVLTKLRAGASLVQVYSGFALHGSGWVARLRTELRAALDAAGFATVGEAIGTWER